MAHSTPTELQFAILRILWERGEATGAEVQEALAPERPLAQSTVATLLSRMERKGLLAHRSEGRQFVYRAEVSEEAVRDSMLDQFSGIVGEIFRGDVAALVSHLLTARDMAPDDLARLRALIEAKERELKGRDS
jgi:predicted transcriptional regulator